MTEQAIPHEGRISRLEGITEQVLQRLDRIERDLRWSIGIQISTGLAVVGIAIKLFFS